MGGVLKCIDDDDDSGGFELSCEIIIHQIFLYYQNTATVRNTRFVYFVKSHERRRETFCTECPKLFLKFDIPQANS